MSFYTLSINLAFPWIEKFWPFNDSFLRRNDEFLFLHTLVFFKSHSNTNTNTNRKAALHFQMTSSSYANEIYIYLPCSRQIYLRLKCQSSIVEKWS